MYTYAKFFTFSFIAISVVLLQPIYISIFAIFLMEMLCH